MCQNAHPWRWARNKNCITTQKEKNLYESTIHCSINLPQSPRLNRLCSLHGWPRFGLRPHEQRDRGGQRRSRAESAVDQSASSSRRIYLLLALAGTLVALFRLEARVNISHRALTFAERVAYQRTIEDVYWRHRIWPEERPDPKPSLDAVMSQAQLEKKVEDSYRSVVRQ